MTAPESAPCAAAQTPQRQRAFTRAPAQIITSDAQAIEAARAYARNIQGSAIERDQQRRLPHAEIDAFSHTGLWAITVPKAFGGADVKQTTLVEVFRIVSQADPSIGQIPQNHFSVVNGLILDGNPALQAFFFHELLQGARFGNAVSEVGTRTLKDSQTRLQLQQDGSYRLNGRKFYATGALFADWIPISAKDQDGQGFLVFLERGTPGLHIEDDWSGIGQRTTASGTVVLDDIEVQPWQLLASQRFGKPTLAGPLSQILQAAIDLGIAHAALEDTRAFLLSRTRPWIDSGVEQASQDPLTLSEIGRLQVAAYAAQAVLEKAAATLDATPAVSTPERAAAASIAVAHAKILTTEVALQASSKLFELAGTRASLEEFGLDRHWRNARTHTLHDPVRWKYHALGDYFVNHTLPPHHLWF